MAKTKTSAVASASLESQEANGVKREASVDDNLAQEMGSASVTAIKKEGSASTANSPTLSATHIKHSRSSSSSSKAKPDLDELDTKPKSDPDTEANMARKVSRAAAKAPPRVAPLYDHLPDVTAEATSTFQVIESSTYQNKYLGFTEAALECDCSEEWGKSSRTPMGHPADDDRLIHADQQCLRRPFRLHQPCHQNGVCG